MDMIDKYDTELAEIRHALRINSTLAEYSVIVKKYNQPVILEVPLGELVGNLAGFAMVWKMQGRLSDVMPITGKERFNAQGLEGKVRVKMALYDALLVSTQTTKNRLNIIKGK